MKYLTYGLLKEINMSRVLAKRNRNLYFDKLPISSAEKYPVTSHFLHNEDEIRTRILFNASGDAGYLDMSIEEFNALPETKWRIQ